MAYTITQKTDGQCLARFQTQDSHEEKLCRNEPSAVAWLIENVRAWNGVNITFDDIAIYEEVQPPVRLVKQAQSKLTLEQRIAELEAKLAKLSP